MTPILFFIFRGLFIVIHVWPRWVFVAAHRLSLAAVSKGYFHCGAQAAQCGGVSHCEAQALGLCTYSMGPQQLQLMGSGARAQ